MRRIAFVLVLVSCGACSSSGGDAVPSPLPSNSNPTPPPTGQDAAQAILDGCVAPALSQFVAVLRAVGDAVDPDTPFPAFAFPNPLQFLTITTIPATWTYQIPGGPLISGTILISPPAGQTIDLSPLLGGLDNLPTVVANLPDGTGIHVTVNFPGFTSAAGAAAFTFEGGTATSASGTVNAAAGTCAFTLDVPEVDPSVLLGGAQNPASADFGAASVVGTLAGTMTFEVDGTITVEAMLDNQDTYRFQFADGVFTPLP